MARHSSCSCALMGVFLKGVNPYTGIPFGLTKRASVAPGNVMTECSSFADRKLDAMQRYNKVSNELVTGSAGSLMIEYVIPSVIHDLISASML